MIEPLDIRQNAHQHTCPFGSGHLRTPGPLPERATACWLCVSRHNTAAVCQYRCPHRAVVRFLTAVHKMARRSRSWCVSSRQRPTMVLCAVRGAGLFMIFCIKLSAPFVQVQPAARGSPLSSTTTTAPTGLLRGGLGLDGSGSTRGGRQRRRVEMTLQVEEGSSAAAAAAADALAARSAAASAVAKPFVSRKLGSFEKMLTQTRDGAGPAEDGVRTLLTPHVWVSIGYLQGVLCWQWNVGRELAGHDTPDVHVYTNSMYIHAVGEQVGVGRI